MKHFLKWFALITHHLGHLLHLSGVHVSDQGFLPLNVIKYKKVAS